MIVLGAGRGFGLDPDGWRGTAARPGLFDRSSAGSAAHAADDSPRAPARAVVIIQAKRLRLRSK
jgi:hypothetical protein